MNILIWRRPISRLFINTPPRLGVKQIRVEVYPLQVIEDLLRRSAVRITEFTKDDSVGSGASLSDQHATSLASRRWLVVMEGSKPWYYLVLA